jgi:YYY domain-containing protein
MTMLVDWFTRESGIFFSWWLLVTLAGWAVLPLCWRLLGKLPDKGYTLARTIGLLLMGFIFWLLASLGLLKNTPGGMLMAALIVLLLSAIALWNGERFNFRAYWRENRPVIIFAEILFFALFLGWAIFRAYQNDTSTTEKPMELAFISGIMRSETFPPNDPWMAGYSISYYYFGYVMSAMLSTLSGVSSTIGFSMTVALWFALTGLNAFGIGYNLVRSRELQADLPETPPEKNQASGIIALLNQVLLRSGRSTPILTGLLASTLLLFSGNFQFPLIEMPYQSRSMPVEYFDFWGTQERTDLDQTGYAQLNPTFSITNSETWGYWWFFRASRVLTDYQLDGSIADFAQPIDEFPMFSFLLGDNHPHVLALPFVVMVLGLALNIVLNDHAPSRYHILFYGVVIGGLIFLNTWDGPIYLIVLVGAEALRRLINSIDRRLHAADWLGLIGFGAALAIVALVAYLPFFIGFRSQAAGVLPNLLYPTHFHHFFLMFGPALLLITGFVATELWRGSQQRRLNWSLGAWTAASVVAVLVIFMLALTIFGALIPQFNSVVQGFVQQNGGWNVVLPGVMARRLAYLPTTLLLVFGLIFVVARLFPKQTGLLKPKESTEIEKNADLQPIVLYSPATGFALLLIGIGVVLTLVPEFVYLRDNFGTRINTIFKFYYQAWIAFSLASAYGIYSVLWDKTAPRPGVLARGLFGGVTIVIFIMGLLYPIFGIHARAMVETGRFSAAPEDLRPLTLDGGARMPLNNDDYQAVMCLSNIVGNRQDVIIVEAVQHAYRSYYARAASLTGIPTLLGWENHQRQWRGATYSEIAGSRAQDIERLYSDLRWDVALEIINRYGIDYIVYGATERQQYAPTGEEKFMDYLDVVCEFGAARIYYIGENIPQEFR